MPRVLQPSEPDKGDIELLFQALERNKDWFEEMITKNSAVLLRGFHVKKAEDFNDIVETCGWDDIRYVGPAPRTHIYNEFGLPMKDPFLRSYTTTMKWFWQVDQQISREIKEFPKKVVLFCEIPPPERREVEEIEKKGLKYTFTALSNNDTSSTRGRDLEKKMRQGKGTRDGYGMAAQWRMWFNTKVGMDGKELSSAMMADGTEIPEKFVKRCEQIIEEESIRFKWEAGDVLFLDNYALLHGRRPSLPPRKVPVATCK
ncbi:hypothetical protein GH714_041029 [Hevea brasiliensis]|uniref:TauD/TfdA-like domain-containing protein n=1 Tax=Hevea brasiliensis TaxID=3981 RepID=A0A6A6N9D3_HEVBR|nr:hypothetical protein GH714_041029 [Hevea brasiliensis]